MRQCPWMCPKAAGKRGPEILARTPIRPNNAWNALGVIGPSRSVMTGCSRQDKRCARESPMKPSARRIERLLAKVEAELARSARPRRYMFHYDEVAEAEAQGLPYVLAPRVLSREEWEKKYCPKEPEASP
jgi:hypothetical protein